MNKRIESALISVYDKDGLDSIIPLLIEQNITVYSTGGTQALLEKHGMKVEAVEDLTGYPSILDGRVKTLHPKVFGGILARRESGHQEQLAKFEIPELDLVVVDLYPFEDTVAGTDDEAAIIEKIDIGGISLIRAAAKNFKDVVTIPSKDQYQDLYKILSAQGGESSLQDRKTLALKAFQVSSHYDTAIFNYFNQDQEELRYGENPHQKASFYGKLEDEFDKLSGKALSYNNLVDIDSAIDLMREFANDKITFAILKHTNSCGIATRDTVFGAYQAALAGDPVSAFGGILICNAPIDLATAEAINKQFYEVLIAPDFDQDAYDLLSKKKKRVLLKRLNDSGQSRKIKTLLGGVIVQEADLTMETKDAFTPVTKLTPSDIELDQLVFANKVVKHLKSNVIVLAKDNQLIGMGCGQTSRVDACKQAIDKAKRMGFEVEGAVMASDAFFPFPDCVEIAHGEGVKCVIQPGGSINDKLSIEFCDANSMAMVTTGIRHFKH
ncbi:UNVERIFIED_CONTAM: hypothetical protein GTU68_057074 [Idotea baltica]|nr:hypothetical protein [Idotea baltica]